MKKKPILKKQMNRQYYYLFGLSVMLMILAFIIESPQSLVSGMMTILVSPSQLFTDYMEIASVGSTLLNVAIMLGISIYSYKKLEIPLNGTVIGSLGMLAGFSFFGKNLFNSIPFMIGVWIYTKVTKQNYRNYVIVGLFGSALGPLISFLAFSGVLPQGWSVLIAYALGIFIGFILPQLTTQFLGFHQGFSLYNVGFTAGIIGMVVLGFMNAFGIEVETRTLTSTQSPLILYQLLIGFCVILIVTSFYLHFKKKEKYHFKLLLKLSGRLPSDFVEMTNLATVTLNMSIIGFILLGYVLMNGGQLNGPIVGSIIGVMSFGAFGNQVKNTVPVLVGIMIGSYLTGVEPTSTSALIAAIFGTTLAPVSGYYGPLAGMIAGFVHITLVSHVVVMHGGLNLYNNGFAGGFVAAVLVPIFEIFEGIRQEMKERKAEG
ncbi:hypothetical protein HMPREF3103_05820 [Granulicatella sp. HMSC30F09]|uniref:DUF1576 domain-containing protein n=2 Tax=Granulicatella TaxID=117563 RepID=UPI0008A1B3C6|nr:DUF1576 domain-containing protein [Granulicatella sp. HMSC30F09]OFT79475.1 hypothetical protein HMPREF3103_05820 [Granulicatella sp. HMSC30F09]